MARSDYVFLTPTWHGDLAFFERMRRSIDRLGLEVDHYVVVHTEDRALFESHFGPSRRFELLTTADVLPIAVERAHVSRRASFQRVDPRRYLQPRPLPGWYSQMFVKLAFAARLGEQPYVCVDSDLIFLREPGPTDFVVRDGACPLYFQEPKWVMEAAWFVRACELLDIPREELILKTHTTWPQLFHPKIALAVCDALEARTGKPWYRVMREHRLAEYELYAAFGRHLWTGSPTLVPVLLEQSLGLTQWHSPSDARAILDRLAADPEIRYFCAQSKLVEGDDEWERIVEGITGADV